MKQWAVKSIIIITAVITVLLGCGQEPLRIDEPESASSAALNETTSTSIINDATIEATPTFDETLADESVMDGSDITPTLSPTITLTATPILPTPTATISIPESIMTPTLAPIYSRVAIQLFSEEFSVVKNSSQLELDPLGDNEQEVTDVEFRITRSGGGDYYFFLLFPINSASVWFWEGDTPNLKNCMVEPPEFSNRASVDKIFPGAYICVVTSQGNIGRIHVTETNLPEGWVKLDFDTWSEAPAGARFLQWAVAWPLAAPLVSPIAGFIFSDYLFYLFRIVRVS